MSSVRWHLAACALAASAGQAAVADEAPHDWQLAGRMGLAQFIIIPEAAARDRAYYQRVIDEACGENSTCFLRFFTNSRHKPVALPLDDAIYQEQTALFNRSMKARLELFRFACRLGMPDDGCF